MSKLTEFLVSQDMFGQPVTVNYRGSDVFRTKFGAIFSLTTYALMLFNLINLVQSFFDGSKQIESQRTEKFDRFKEDGFSLEDNLVQLSIINLHGEGFSSVGTPRVSLATHPEGNVDGYAYEKVALNECEGDRRQKIVDYWQPRNSADLN